MLPWVKIGGRLVVPGSQHPADVPEHSGVVAEGRFAYQVPCGGAARTLWIGRRVD
jgi:hypothetical protein